MAEKKTDKTDLSEFLLAAQNDLGNAMAFLEPKTGRILQSNDAFSKTFGYSQKDLSSLPSFSSLVPAENQAAVREHLKAAAEKSSFETMAIDKSGRRLWIEISLRSVKIGSATQIAALVTDITRRREAEEQVLLLETITLAVNDAPDFQTALGVVLRKVCIATGWEYGLAWVPVPERKVLTIGTGSYGAGLGLDRFRTAMGDIEIAFGDDLPGRAWAMRQPQWVEDMTLLRSFRRQAILREFGIQLSMAIPVVAMEHVVAVLEFCVTDRQAHAKDFFVGLASAIAPQLGSLFQRKHAEQERDRFFALSPDLMCVAGFDYYFKLVNSSFEAILGFSTTELLSNSYLTFVHPEDRARTQEMANILAAGGQTTSFECRFVAKDGTPHWFLWAATMDKEERVIYAVGRDITARKAADVELKETNTFLDSIIENIPNMIFIKDAKFLRFVRFNRAGEALLGMKREELIGKNDYDLFPPEEADFFIEKDRQVLKNGKLVDIPEEIIHTRNGVRILHTKKIPILDESGKPLYLLGISEDVTERKKP